VPVPPPMAQMHAPAPSPAAPLPPPGAPPRSPNLGGTRVDVLDAARAIGTQIAAQTKGFLPFEAIANDSKQLRLDYERLRIIWELTRDIGLERDLDVLLDKILLALFKFTKADRGVILLRENDGTLHPRAARRRDGTTAAIQVSSTILNHVITERMGVLTHDASMDFAASKGKSMILNRISSAMVVPLLHENEKEVLGVVWLDSESLAQFQPKDLELITSVAGQAAMFIENTILAKKVEQEILVRDRFQRLVAPNVAEMMISGKLDVRKGGQLIQELTIYNSDIRGFTAMSEGTSAETLVEMLNEYFELMVETLFKYEGTLDKFMGDGIMAFWGAPLVHRDDAIRCVQCALDQMEVLGRFNRERIGVGKPALAVGLGIHTGPGVVGYVGSSKALSYTTIGDTANTSARLCSSAASGQIVISETTLSKLGNRFEFEEIEPRSLKGKERPMRRFNILREKPTAVVARAGGLS
jgi:adenylate cyclase